MDSDWLYDEHDESYEKCGEVFFTVNGNIAFHCTLCENIYKSCQEYNDHILEVHFAQVFNEELTVSMTEEENTFHTPSDEYYPIEDVELIYNKNEETDIYPTQHVTHVPDQLDITNYKSEVVDRLAELPSKDLSEKDFDQSVQPDLVKSSNTASNLYNKAIRANLRTINVKTTITNRKYKCPHCGFLGADRANMKKHIKRHSLNKPHQCTECPKAFHSRTELKTHLRIHTGERPYLCTLCGQAFATSSKLSSHQKRHYNIRDKECQICKMRFFGTYPLREHMAVHSEKRDFKCQQCDASFKLPLALKNHMKLHENKRQYQCKMCDSRFNQHAGLYSHMKSSHAIVFNAAKGSVKNELDE